MAGTKRAAEDDSGPTTRSSKTAKTSPASKPKKGGKKATKHAMPVSAFKSKALPLHMNLTHTPPALPDAEDATETPADPGLIGTLTLVATSFKTGSYGWKGNKRVKIELQGEGDEKETVDVQFTINATVLNSKGAEEEADDKEEKEEHEDDNADEDK